MNLPARISQAEWDLFGKGREDTAPSETVSSC